MPIYISASELLLGAGDFLTIYLFGYMHRTFCEKRKYMIDRPWLVPIIYLLDWCMLFCANLQEIPPLNLLAMISSYLIPLFLVYYVKSFRQLTNFLFYLVGVMATEIVVGISSGYLNNEMGFRTQYERITPQTALLMNFIEMILVLFICRFGSKEKDRKSDNMIFLLMAMPFVSVALIVVDMFVLAVGKYENFNSGQFLRMAVLLVIVNIAIFVILEKYTELMRQEMELVQEKLSDKYYILNAETDPNYPLMTTRLCKKGTVFREEALKDVDCELGIFLDLYAYDNLADGKFAYSRQVWSAWFWSKLLILRTISHPYMSLTGWKRTAAQAVCSFVNGAMKLFHISPRWIYKRCIRQCRKYDDKETKRMGFPCDTDPNWNTVEKVKTYPLVKYPFEDVMLNFPNDIDGILRGFYGDYMELPPVEKRKTHYPHVLDFGDGINVAK